jgi:hypothetical protein
MLFLFSTPELIRNLWQLKTAVYLYWCLTCAVPFFFSIFDLKFLANLSDYLNFYSFQIFTFFHIVVSRLTRKSETSFFQKKNPFLVTLMWLYAYSTVVEHVILNPKIEGLDPPYGKVKQVAP